jgi:hypothetical protein
MTNLVTSLQIGSTIDTIVAWLYHRYKYRIPKNDPLKATHYYLPPPLLDHILTSFSITHSYFSSPVTCSTTLTHFYSLYTRDKIFRSLEDTFTDQWVGWRFTHPHSIQAADQALHWARLATQEDPTNITLLLIQDQTWYYASEPHKHLFPDTHILAHFEADTLPYFEPTIPKELIETCTEPLRLLCIHHQQNLVSSFLEL